MWQRRVVAPGSAGYHDGTPNNWRPVCQAVFRNGETQVPQCLSNAYSPFGRSEVGRPHGTGPQSRTSILPRFSPRSMPRNASGAFSMPSTTVSSYRSFPSRSQPVASWTNCPRRWP